MTPRKTIYISEKDEPIWKRAEELAGTSLSALLARLLRDYVAATEQRQPVKEELERAVRKAFGGLSEKEYLVLARRIGLGDNNPRTLREVGAAMGISPETVRKIEAEAHRKLRHLIPADTMRAFLSTATALDDFFEPVRDEAAGATMPKAPRGRRKV